MWIHLVCLRKWISTIPKLLSPLGNHWNYVLELNLSKFDIRLKCLIMLGALFSSLLSLHQQPPLSFYRTWSLADHTCGFSPRGHFSHRSKQLRTGARAQALLLDNRHRTVPNGWPPLLGARENASGLSLWLQPFKSWRPERTSHQSWYLIICVPHVSCFCTMISKWYLSKSRHLVESVWRSKALKGAWPAASSQAGTKLRSSGSTTLQRLAISQRQDQPKSTLW